tara:strand:- start:1227 stop:1574 length:348 start_codon:yes stop_codon:yes gene_type:complete
MRFSKFSVELLLLKVADSLGLRRPETIVYGKKGEKEEGEYECEIPVHDYREYSREAVARGSAPVGEQSLPRPHRECLRSLLSYLPYVKERFINSCAVSDGFTWPERIEKTSTKSE